MTSAEEIKALGNQQYEAGRYAEAARTYTRLIEVLASGDGGGGVAASNAYSNRAAALMALSRYSDAGCDAERAFQLDPTNLKACLRAATCAIRCGELPTAQAALAQAPGCRGTSTETSAKIAVVQADLKRKRTLMAGHPYSLLTASRVLTLLETCHTSTVDLKAVPPLVYRMRRLLRCHYSRILPDADAFDVGADDAGLRLHQCAAQLAYGLPPAQLATLVTLPGAHDLLFHDNFDATPAQLAMYDRRVRLRAIRLGDVEETEADAAVEEPTDREVLDQDMAAYQMAFFIANMLVGLATRAPDADVQRRAIERLAYLSSHRLYQVLLGDAVSDALKLQLKDSAFVARFVKAGGLTGLASDFKSSCNAGLAGAALCALPAGAYAEYAAEAVAIALEHVAGKIDGLGPEEQDEERRKLPLALGLSVPSGKETRNVVSEVMRRVWMEHGIAPFARAGRLNAFINFVHAALQIVDTRAPGVGLAFKPAWASMLRLWLTLERTPRGEKHQMVVMRPSQREEHLNFLRKHRRCSNPRCSGERMETDENGVGVVTACKGCRTKYCSAGCALRDPGHSKSCRKLWKEGA